MTSMILMTKDKVLKALDGDMFKLLETGTVAYLCNHDESVNVELSDYVDTTHFADELGVLFGLWDVKGRHDYENLPEICVLNVTEWKFSPLLDMDQLERWYEIWDDLDEDEDDMLAYLAYREDVAGWLSDPSVSDFKDHYLGTAANAEAYAQGYIEELHPDLPEIVVNNIDWKGVAGDLERVFIDAPKNQVYVFEQ